MNATIKLDYPVTIDSGEISELNLRRPKVKDMRDAEKAGTGDADRELALFARLTGLNPEDLEQLDLKDYQKLQKEYSGFLS